MPAQSPDTDAAAKDGSLKARMRAWWNGTEAEKAAAKQSALPSVARQRPRREPKGEAVDDPDLRNLMLAPFVWGEGYSNPGSEEFITSLVAPLNPNEEKSMLYLGAGLGGPARQVAKRYKSWISGYDREAGIVEKGTEMSKMAGLGNRVTLESFDPEAPKLPARKFDCAFAEPLFFAVEHKLELFRDIELALKPGGQLLFLDFVAGNIGEDMLDKWEQWLEAERPLPRPRTVKELKQVLDQAKLDFRTNIDVTADYLTLINQGWTRCVEALHHQLNHEPDRARFLFNLELLAVHWMRRYQLIAAGALKVVRIEVAKKAFGRNEF